MSPSQWSGSPLLGVDPFTTQNCRFRALVFQWHGIPPIHLTPESLYSGYARKRLASLLLRCFDSFRHGFPRPSEARFFWL